MTEGKEILIDDPESWFGAILIALNSESPIRRSEMRRLFEAWRSSGPDVQKLLRSNPELRKYLWGENGQPMWRAHPMPIGTGIRITIEAYATTRPMNREEFLQDEARLMFMHFLMNPLRDQILGPCARKNCGRYFRRRRKSDTKYCSRECAQLQAGANSADRRRETERKEKLKRANQSIKRWVRTRTNLDWKTFVHQEEPDITPKFLTRAVTEKDLQNPTKKGR
jgi:hypothetical protein